MCHKDVALPKRTGLDDYIWRLLFNYSPHEDVSLKRWWCIPNYLDCWLWILFKNNNRDTKKQNYHMSHVVRKPVFAICEQQRRRSACESAQSDQRLCFRCLDSIISKLSKSKNFKPIASLCSWASRFESYLVANSKDRFSRDEANADSDIAVLARLRKYLLFYLQLFSLHCKTRGLWIAGYRKILKLRTPNKFAVITHKIEQDCFTEE